MTTIYMTHDYNSNNAPTEMDRNQGTTCKQTGEEMRYTWTRHEWLTQGTGLMRKGRKKSLTS